MSVHRRLVAALLTAPLLAGPALLGLVAPGAAHASGPGASPVTTSATAGIRAGAYADASVFVSALYRDLLDREPDPAGLDYWCRQLAGGQLSAGQLARALAGSDEWVGSVVTGLYRDALGREPDPAGLAGWRAALHAGLPVATLAAAVYGSEESYARAGGTDPAWVAALYTALFGRAPDPAGAAGWTSRTAGVGRQRVALELFQSDESLYRRIEALYEDLLGRAADPTGLRSWPAVLREHGDLELAAALTSSLEYLTRARARAADAPPSPVPFGRTLFGASLPFTAGESRAETVARNREQFGALPVARIYADLPTGTWDQDGVVAALGTGTAVIYSVAVPSMAAAAAGAYDARIAAFLGSRPAGLPVWFVLKHEPEDDVDRGAFTAAQFRDATARLAPVARAAGAVPTTVLTAASAFGERWRAFYTPAVDVLAWDAYNSYQRGDADEYRSADRFLEPVLGVARETGKAFGWAEFGGACIPSDPSCAGRAAWLTQVGSAFGSSGAQFASYWNRTSMNGEMAYGLHDARSVAAWRALVLG